MDPSFKNNTYEPPSREWPGINMEIYIDEVPEALLAHRPKIVDKGLAKQANKLVQELSLLDPKEAISSSEIFSGRQIEVEGISYTLNNVIGSGDDGVYFSANDSNRNGVLKVSWPFNPSRQTASELDRYRMESAYIERQALMEISHAPNTISFEAPFILPRLFSEGLIINQRNASRVCSSVLFMEKMEGVSFDDFMKSIEETNSLKDFVQVSLSALNAQFHLSELGDPDEPQIGIFRTDNGVHNLLVSRDSDGLKAICLDYGSCEVPAFTGDGGNRSLTSKENTELRLNFSVELLRSSLAETLSSSSLKHSKKQDVIQLLKSSGSLNPSELFEALKKLELSLDFKQETTEPEDSSELESIKLPSRQKFVKDNSKAA